MIETKELNGIADFILGKSADKHIMVGPLASRHEWGFKKFANGE